MTVETPLASIAAPITTTACLHVLNSGWQALKQDACGKFVRQVEARKYYTMYQQRSPVALVHCRQDS